VGAEPAPDAPAIRAGFTRSIAWSCVMLMGGAVWRASWPGNS